MDLLNLIVLHKFEGIADIDDNLRRCLHYSWHSGLQNAYSFCRLLQYNVQMHRMTLSVKSFHEHIHSKAIMNINWTTPVSKIILWRQMPKGYHK